MHIACRRPEGWDGGSGGRWVEVAGEGWAGALMGMEPGVAGMDGGSGPLGDGGLGVEAAGGEDLWQSSQVTIFDPAVEGAQVGGVGGGLKAALGGNAGEAVAGETPSALDSVLQLGKGV